MDYLMVHARSATQWHLAQIIIGPLNSPCKAGHLVTIVQRKTGPSNSPCKTYYLVTIAQIFHGMLWNSMSSVKQKIKSWHATRPQAFYKPQTIFKIIYSYGHAKSNNHILDNNQHNVQSQQKSYI